MSEYVDENRKVPDYVVQDLINSMIEEIDLVLIMIDRTEGEDVKAELQDFRRTLLESQLVKELED